MADKQEGRNKKKRSGKGGSPPLTNSPPDSYGEVLETIKARVLSARMTAALAVNRELVLLYWRIGREILNRQRDEGWGAKVVDRLSKDLRRAFPEMKGFSARNLKYMRRFAEAYSDEQFVQQLAAQMPWFHNCVLLEKVKDPAQREFYIHKTIENGWSRNVLAIQIQSGLFHRQGKALTNFDATLPPPQSDLARETLKDPYAFDFLTLADDAHERDIQLGLVEHIRNFLLELGVGFSYIGSQHHLEVDGRDYFIDMLFYHLQLRCYVVIELKVGEFKPEFVGKMNFYLSAVDDQLRHPDDAPSIGLILCRSKSKLTVEYALRDTRKPMGVSEYQFTSALPDAYKGSLPTIKELEAELGETESDDKKA